MHQSRPSWGRTARIVALMAVAERISNVASFSRPAMCHHHNNGLTNRHQRLVLRLLHNEDMVYDDDEVTSTSSTTSDDFSFFDEASIYVRAGSGGQGSSTYKKAKKGQNGIPDGGAGGTGGNILLQLDESLNTLAGLSRRALRPNAFGGGGGAASSKRLGHKQTKERLLSFRAEGGKDGGRMYDNGRCGEDCFVRVPPGTVVSYELEPEQNGGHDTHENEDAKSETSQGDLLEDETDKAPVEYDLQEIGTLSFDEPALLVARGGRGGDGTASLRGKKGKKRVGPAAGERFRLRLTLKIVADVAIVGVPNAGKSTFLAAVTRAKPKIADYPFTTIIPNLGVWIPDETATPDYTDKSQAGAGGAAGSTGLVLCDVPGLIEGAADGVGLGHAFLRHVERCRVILHLVDATSQDPVGDYRMVNEEIRKYGNGNLAKMPQVVVVNKIDAWDEDEDERNPIKKSLEEKLKSEMSHTRLLWASAKERDGVDDLMTRMSAYVGKVKESQAVAVET